jgi:hypothetical protein
MAFDPSDGVPHDPVGFARFTNGRLDGTTKEWKPEPGGSGMWIETGQPVPVYYDTD